MLGLTSLVAYSSTILAGILAFIIALIVIPMITSTGGSAAEAEAIEPIFDLEIDPIVGVMTSLVTALVFGIGLTRVESPTLRSFFDEGKEIVERLIWKIIIPILPLDRKSTRLNSSNVAISYAVFCLKIKNT